MTALRPILDNARSLGLVDAARLLWEVNQRAEEVLPILGNVATLVNTGQVHPHDPDATRDGALLLAEMGPAARPAWPTLYHVFLQGSPGHDPYQPGVPSPLAAIALALEEIEREPGK